MPRHLYFQIIPPRVRNRQVQPPVGDLIFDQRVVVSLTMLEYRRAIRVCVEAPRRRPNTVYTPLWVHVARRLVPSELLCARQLIQRLPRVERGIMAHCAWIEACPGSVEVGGNEPTRTTVETCASKVETFRWKQPVEPIAALNCGCPHVQIEINNTFRDAKRRVSWIAPFLDLHAVCETRRCARVH